MVKAMDQAELIEEIKNLRPQDSVNAYWARFKYCVFGKTLRGSLYPPRKILYRRDKARYEDDGHTFAYQHGQFCTTHYTLRRDGSHMTLTIGKRTGDYVPAQRTVTVQVKGRDTWASDDATEFEDDGAEREIRLTRHDHT